MSKRTIEYGRRLSTSLKINFKAIGYSIPIILIFTFLLSYHFRTDLYFGIGGLLSIPLAIISTQGDQRNIEAFENGLKIPVFWRYFRQFVPYRNIVYICRFNSPYRLASRYRNGLVVFHGILHRDPSIRIWKPPNYPSSPRRMKYACWIICDGAKTPFHLVIPQMKKHVENWKEVYNPNVILKNFGELDRLYIELNSKSLAPLTKDRRP